MYKESWMENLQSSMPLREVTVPGSHDAGMWDVHIGSPWNSARTGSAATFAKIAKYTTPCTTVNYAKTQNLDLVDQFREGVRYFDLRVAKHIENGKVQYRFTHGLLGSDFLDGMRDLIKYSNKFPKEILICDVRFIFGFTDQDHQIFQDSLLNIIGDRLADNSFRTSTKLSEFWETKKNVILIYHSANRYKNFWPSSRIGMTWPNTTNSDVAIEKMGKFITGVQNSWYINTDKFYGLHATLTPDNLYVGLRLWGSVQHLANKLNKKMVKLMKEDWKEAKLSFVMYDVVEYPGLADAIIQSNF